MIRVLVVDDSPTLRLLIRTILERDQEIKVVSEARNGEEAITTASIFKPDLITMDINMPGIGGYEAIRQIMNSYPCPIIVLTGIESRHLMDVSFKSLQLGALTVLPKPASMNMQDSSEAANLISQIKIMAGVKVIRRQLAPNRDETLSIKNIQGGPASNSSIYTPPASGYNLVAVGVSTGGPPALQTFLSGLSSSFPLPIVVVQHISKGFVDSLAEWLTKTTPFGCRVVTSGETLQGGRVYLAPDNVHLTLQKNGLVWLSDEKPVEGLRPSVNKLFETVAKNYGPSAIGVLLTGMGRDGAKGLLAMKQAGAYTIAQDEASSVIFGMPKEAIDLGAVKEVLPLEQIAGRILTLAKIVER